LEGISVSLKPMAFIVAFIGGRFWSAGWVWTIEVEEDGDY
jgi:hypothetical protein